MLECSCRDERVSAATQVVQLTKAHPP